VREWFDPRPGAHRRRHAAQCVPATTVPPTLIERFLA